MCLIWLTWDNINQLSIQMVARTRTHLSQLTITWWQEDIGDSHYKHDIQSHGPAPRTSQRIGDHMYFSKYFMILFSRNLRPSLVCQASYKWHISHFTLIQSLVFSISCRLMNITSGPGGLHSALLITLNDHKGIFYFSITLQPSWSRSGLLFDVLPAQLFSEHDL